jgi:hypothetical protein
MAGSPRSEGRAQARDVELRITAKECVLGTEYDGPDIWIRVFDAANVPDLIGRMQEFRLHGNPVDSAATDKMLDIYNELERRVNRTHALYRSKQPLSTPRIVKVPLARRYVIFGLGFDESAATGIAEQELEPNVGKLNNVVLNFSDGHWCITP